MGDAIIPKPKQFKPIETPPEACHTVPEQNNRPPPPPPDSSIPIPVNNPFEASFQDWLELTLERTEDLYNEIFSKDAVVPQEVGPLTVNKTIQNVQNVANVQGNPMQALARTVMPKMQFNNSTVTINFNIQS